MGRKLYSLLEKDVAGITSTKDYMKSLKGYIDDLGLAFHNAFLFEKIGD